MTIFQDVFELQGLIAGGEVDRWEWNPKVAAYPPYVQARSIMWQTQLQGINARPLRKISMVPNGAQDATEVRSPVTPGQVADIFKHERSRGGLRYKIDGLLE